MAITEDIKLVPHHLAKSSSVIDFEMKLTGFR